MKLVPLNCCAMVLFCVGTIGASTAHAAEFGEATPYYEDDALLDITEWFDGNDYNPTDETWWRWDDEVYQASKDVSGDRDNDSWYGYTSDRDWYYDYYDPDPYAYYNDDDSDLYTSGIRYYDYDNDGVFDAYASYLDSDRDGLYEDYDYCYFASAGTDKQQQLSQKRASSASRQQSVTGNVEQTKQVQVPGGGKNLVARITPQDKSQKEPVIVDLGSAKDLKDSEVKKGDQITVSGPRAHVGEHDVILARSASINGKTISINRESPRSITGRVVNVHETKAIRGKAHLFAMLETSSKEKPQKIAVDLGSADALTIDVKKGDNLTVSGFPVKIKEKTLIVAQAASKGDKSVEIRRQQRQPANSSK